jgi:integrase
VAPHIYREEEIVALLDATRSLGPPGSLRPATYEALFGLMAATGLRVCEAIHLSEGDVDLTRGILTVRKSKFAKSRQVPLHPTTVAALKRFRRRRRRDVASTGDTPFFTGNRGQRLGQPLSDRQVHRVFNQLRDRLNWLNRGAHAAPRLHDLRHTFAVRRLMQWQRDGADLDQRMLALSTYLGHAKITDTYWYLSAVPQLMVLAGDTFERFVALAGGDDA